VKTRSYVGMRRLTENREEWRAATYQSLDWWPMMMMKGKIFFLISHCSPQPYSRAPKARVKVAGWWSSNVPHVTVSDMILTVTRRSCHNQFVPLNHGQAAVDVWYMNFRLNSHVECGREDEGRVLVYGEVGNVGNLIGFAL
jgi:hypothetical protein